MRERREDTYSATAEEGLGAAAAAREWRKERRIEWDVSVRRKGGSSEEVGLC